MDMYNYFNKLNQIAISKQNHKLIVDNNLVDAANKIIKQCCINDAKDAFLYFSALNYLNSCVKIDSSITYRFKNLVQNGVNVLLNKNLNNIKMYYNIYEKVFYISFVNFILSFHFVNLNSTTTLILTHKPIIKFDGIKKHPCGDIIFLEALKNLNINVDQFYNTNYSKDSEINDVINSYKLDRLVTNESSKRNIAIVLLQLHYIDDKILKDNIPLYLKKAFYREIVILSFSIIEALELEVGAKILKEKTYKIYLSSQERINDEARFKKAYADNINMDLKTKQYYSNFKFKRNNVHLSKQQVIEFDEDYSEDKKNNILIFMEEYMNFMLDFVKDERL